MRQQSSSVIIFHFFLYLCIILRTITIVEALAPSSNYVRSQLINILRQTYYDVFTKFVYGSNVNVNNRRTVSIKQLPTPAITHSETSELINIGDLSSFSIAESLSTSKQRTRPKIGARILSWILNRLVRSKSKLVEGLDVYINSKSNRDLLMGKVDAIDLSFKRICIAQIYVSGGRVVIDNVQLRLGQLLFDVNRQPLQSPYRVYGDFLLTNSDIVNSRNIRNLLQMLVNIILEHVLVRQFLRIKVTKVTIRNRRIVAVGEVDMDLGLSSTTDLASFEVSTSLGVQEEGQVVYLKDCKVIVNPNSNSRASWNVALNEPIGVDLGPQCRIESLSIGNSAIWLRILSVISPVVPEDSDKPIVIIKRAKYHYDLSKCLSKLLQLPGGVLVRMIKN